MNTSKVTRFKVLGLLGLPVIVVAIVLLLLSWSHGSVTQVEADESGADLPVFSMGIGGDGQDIANDTECATKGDNAGRCDLSKGGSYTMNVYVNAFRGTEYGGFTAYFTATGQVSFIGAYCEPKALGDLFNLSGLVNGDVEVTCAYNPATNDPFTHKGPERVGYVNFTCDAQGPIESKITLDLDESVIGADTPAAANLQIHCVPPPPTPTFTPTPTPPPKPRIQKLEDGESVVNNWLERQGDKIPPAPRCDDGNDVTTFQEVMSLDLRNPDPKDPESTQQLGAFEFEVRFDPKLVCVNLVPSPVWEALIDSGDAVCMVDDKDEGLDLEGIARMGCFTVGKPEGDQWIDTTTDEGKHLADVEVRPQPDIYSMIRPNQDNGIPVQILNQDCDLGDLQGHPVTLFSCEDADITFRYLEGDMEPDCAVNALDTQSLAFRWGVGIGSLLYNERFDVEPSGAVKGDGDIDILDLQFVYGRWGSTCGDPHPDQDPVNPKEE